MIFPENPTPKIMSTPNDHPNNPDRTLRKRNLAEKENSIKQKQQKH